MNFKRKIPDVLALLCYIGLIYTTLSIVPRLYFFFRKIFGPALRVITNVVLVSGTFLLLYIFYNRLKGRKFVVYLGLAIVLFIYLLLIICYTPIIPEKVHLVEYGFLSYLALRVFRDMRSRDKAYLCAIVIVAIVGYFDELIQGFLPNRVYELRDVYLNVLSGLLGLALVRLYKI